MDILVVGSGGREHALVANLSKNPKVDRLFALPGNAGMASVATLVPIGAKELDKIVRFAKQENIDFVVVGPDDPLVLGLVDLLEAENIPCFGPDKKSAILEGSKVFSKALMKRYQIPSAMYEVFDRVEDALAYAETCTLPSVVKADGLALGKGVIIAHTKEVLQATIKAMMVDKVFGPSGERIVIEEFLSGPEVSVLTFTDGVSLVPMPSSMDHKRAFDGDQGPNTGGMGVIAPNPFYTPAIEDLCMRTIFLPTMHAMNMEGRTFKGCLYFGLMLTEGGPKVIEYNARFGDPEAQAVLPLLKSDLLSIMMAVSQQMLSSVEVKFSSEASCCVVLASAGYPGPYETGKRITLGEFEEGVLCLHAGTKFEGTSLVTNGGRVADLVATAESLEQAIEKAYRAVGSVSFDGMQYRKDIGKVALEA